MRQYRYIIKNMKNILSRQPDRPNKNDDPTQDSRLEGWLSIPKKQNIKKHGWKKQYVVVSSKKIIFYNSESDKQNTDPVLILDANLQPQLFEKHGHFLF